MDLETILHVDDDDDIRTIVQLALEVVGGLKLQQFSNGKDALAALATCKPQLLLSDVMMPTMSGPDLLKEVRKMEGMEDLPTIFVTAQAEQDHYKDLMDTGAIAVITKPFDPMTLANEIKGIWGMYKAEH